MTTEEILFEAALRCERYGLHKGELWPGAALLGQGYVPDSPCCALGHIRVAAGLTAPEIGVGDWDRSGASNAEGELADYLARVANDGDVDVAEWSDAPSRSATDVAAAMRAAAGRAA